MTLMDDQLPFSQVLDQLFDSPQVPINLIYRLSDLSPEQMEQLRERWVTEPDERRRLITRHMADISEENFVVDFSPVLKMALGDSEAAVRLAALDGLWDTSNTLVVSPIIGLMESDPEEQVRASAAATLGHFVLMGEWNQINQRVAGRIVDALLRQVDNPATADAVRRAALESLGNAAHERVPDLIREAYGQDNEAMRLSAIFAMGRSADRQWTPYILDEMRHPRADMRIEAARAAGNIGDSNAVDRLIELLADEDLEVQMAAVTALGQIGSEEAYEILRHLAADPEAEALWDMIEESMEEIEWLGGEIDLAMFDWEEDEDDF